jgi:hypothetical protein
MGGLIAISRHLHVCHQYRLAATELDEDRAGLTILVSWSLSLWLAAKNKNKIGHFDVGGPAPTTRQNAVRTR